MRQDSEAEPLSEREAFIADMVEMKALDRRMVEIQSELARIVVRIEELASRSGFPFTRVQPFDFS